MKQLAGKTALVTGYNKGIGSAIAIALAEAGANIVGVCRSSDDATVDVQMRIRANGVRSYFFNADLGKREDLYRFIEEVRSCTTIDILINNAGMIARQPAALHEDELWDDVLAVNLDAAFILTREFGKEMLERGKGWVVMICSMLSYQGGINVPGYTASKSALAGLVKAFSNEWASKGVHVNGIAPGYIATDNTRALQGDVERSRQILERIPAGRWGRPEDLAGAVLFLCSGGADYVHGTIINVDGGWMGR